MLFFKRRNSEDGSPVKQKIKEMKCRQISYVDTDFSELISDIKSDRRAILKLKPVNYYAVKNQYIMAHIYSNSDLSENYVFFTRVEYEKRTDKSDYFDLETDTVKKALAKVGIIL
ncbi:hypothetical protein SAMN02910317_00622 [Ruminococcaceae bacterium FB2012]|nr:hypothetical protein SAMN02910317_00622 [Ruminococcaceae bacterium FB2012]